MNLLIALCYSASGVGYCSGSEDLGILTDLKEQIAGVISRNNVDNRLKEVYDLDSVMQCLRMVAPEEPCMHVRLRDYSPITAEDYNLLAYLLIKVKELISSSTCLGSLDEDTSDFTAFSRLGDSKYLEVDFSDYTNQNPGSTIGKRDFVRNTLATAVGASIVSTMALLVTTAMFLQVLWFLIIGPLGLPVYLVTLMGYLLFNVCVQFCGDAFKFPMQLVADSFKPIGDAIGTAVIQVKKMSSIGLLTWEELSSITSAKDVSNVYGMSLFRFDLPLFNKLVEIDEIVKLKVVRNLMRDSAVYHGVVLGVLKMFTDYMRVNKITIDGTEVNPSSLLKSFVSRLSDSTKIDKFLYDFGTIIVWSFKELYYGYRLLEELHETAASGVVKEYLAGLLSRIKKGCTYRLDTTVTGEKGETALVGEPGRLYEECFHLMMREREPNMPSVNPKDG
eukprot:NODE_42_length_29671_cov_0.584810.p4 type:complete len:447 gc:universal NODE_42_length_29671_cov_0.584810:5490-4150(-)